MLMCLMSLVEQVKEILLKNHNLRRYKDDAAVTSNCVRIINLFVEYGFIHLDENGGIVEFKACKLDSLTNFELLDVIESVIRSSDKTLFDNSFAKLIQSIDYTGQCWYYPKELSGLIFERTSKRINYKRIRTILNQLTEDNTCMRITNKKRQSMYRIRFTYDGLED